MAKVTAFAAALFAAFQAAAITATKEYVDRRDAETYASATNAIATSVDFSTNNTELVETIEAKAPSPGDYAAVSNAAVHAAITNALQDAALAGKATKADATLTERGPNHDGFSAWTVTPSTYDDGTSVYDLRIEWFYDGWCVVSDDPVSPGAVSTFSIPKGTAADTTISWVEDVDAVENITAIRTALPGYQLGSQTDKPLASAAEVDALRNDNAQTRQIVMTWENFLDGSNVVFSITNYMSGTYSLDAAKITVKELREGEYREIYNSRDEILLHINDFSNRYVRVAINAIVDEVAARLASKADRDWGKYTSAGGDAPANTVYMTAPNTVFAGGLEYERVAVGEGTICVLTTRGAPVWTQGDEGTFKFQDDGGTNYFGFAKTDSYTIGANTDGITVQGGMVTLNYNITMSGRPCVWYKASLSSGAWEQLNLPDGSPVDGASYAVTWEANPDPGTQVCYINLGNAPSGFFRATVEVAGEAKFMTNMPADLSSGMFCTDGVHRTRPVYNNGSVTWEVLQ